MTPWCSGYDIEVSEFELLSRYYVPFRTYTLGKAMDPFILAAMGWIAIFLQGWLWVDMPLNQETNQKLFRDMCCIAEKNNNIDV